MNIMSSPFTPKEEEAMSALVMAHNAFCELPVTHPHDSTEWASALHRLQDIIAVRILRREYPEHFVLVSKKE